MYSFRFMVVITGLLALGDLLNDMSKSCIWVSSPRVSTLYWVLHRDLTRFNNIVIPDKTPRWQVDKEALAYRESNN